jgi:predicted PurR-regulated permease PerM
MALYVAALYLVIQFLESYIVTPLIQKRMAALPPVLLIGMQVLLGLVAGLLGVMLAAPLAVSGMMAVKMLWVEDALGDPTAETLSEQRGESATAAAG